MRMAWSEKRKMTLAEYFCEKKGHLLEDIVVLEIDEKDNARIVRGEL